jgi:hypothetical protein
MKNDVDRQLTSSTLFEPITPEAFRDQAFWILNGGRFTLFAERRIRRFFQGGRRPPGGKDAADYVSEAAALLIDGRRRYPEHYSRERWVYATLASLLSHDATSAEGRQRVVALVEDVVSDDDDDHEESAEISVPPFDDDVVTRDVLEKFKMNFRDERVHRYLDLLADDYVSAAEAAESLALTESDINGMRKMFKRARKKWAG